MLVRLKHKPGWRRNSPKACAFSLLTMTVCVGNYNYDYVIYFNPDYVCLRGLSTELTAKLKSASVVSHSNTVLTDLCEN